ncbi:MAG TPA: LpqB family beta-propeller domain-containing protein [Gemmatimonadales bacterium]|jgi:dipeptidyl aminopeptidase/acylaminoacyl peptidase|nr:LpqB family beta-propeller domain-containing protein [Gemmatimonadales bacterium]
MTRPYFLGNMIGLALGAGAWLGCSSESSVTPSGRIEVDVARSGVPVDLTGLVVILDQRARAALNDSGTVAFDAVEPGTHRITLAGVDSRCQVSPGLESDLVAAEDDTARVEFAISCPAGWGAIQVVTTTSGSDADPDGYMVLVDDGPRLRVDDAGVHQLTATEGPHSVRLADLSPNCVLAGAEVQAVEVAAEQVTQVTFAIDCIAVPSAGPGREIAFVSDRDADSLRPLVVYVMNDDGSHVHRLSDTLSREHTSPAWSPDGARLAIVGLTSNLAPAITVGTADGALVRQLRMEHPISFNSELSWSLDATGILFTTFDEGCPEVVQAQVDGSGESVVMSDDHCPDDILAFRYSPDGARLAFLRACFSCNIPATELVVRNATTLEDVELPCFISGPSDGLSWSPDGRKLAIDSGGELGEELFGHEIWIMDLEARTCSQITSGPEGGSSPSWSPDGSRITLVSTRDGNPEIYVMNADGSGQRRLTSNTGLDAQPAWRP